MRKISFLQALLITAILLLAFRCNILGPAIDPTPPNTPTETTETPSKRPTPPTKKAEDNLRKDIIRYAQQFQGRPYLYAGKDPKTGFDCSGFTHFVMKEFDIDLSSSSRAQELQGTSIPLSSVKAGDLIFYRRPGNNSVFHVSLVVDKTQEGISVIHSTSRGVVIDNISTSSYWKPKISTARNVVSSKF